MLCVRNKQVRREGHPSTSPPAAAITILSFYYFTSFCSFALSLSLVALRILAFIQCCIIFHQSQTHYIPSAFRRTHTQTRRSKHKKKGPKTTSSKTCNQHAFMNTPRHPVKTAIYSACRFSSTHVAPLGNVSDFTRPALWKIDVASMVARASRRLSLSGERPSSCPP